MKPPAELTSAELRERLLDRRSEALDEFERAREELRVELEAIDAALVALGGVGDGQHER